MASFYPCVKNHASGYIFYVGLVSQASTKSLQGSATLAAGDVKVSIDGGALNNLGTLPVVTPAASKSIKVTLSQAEINGDNIIVIFADAAGAEWCDLLVNIQTVPRRFDDLAYPATSGRSMVVDANGLVDANVVKLGPSGSGTAQTARDVGGQLDAAVSTRATPAQVNTEADAALADYDPPTKAELDTGLAALNDLSAAEVNAEVVDALNVDTYAEPGQEAPAATNTLVKKIGYLFKLLRNKIATTASQISVYNDAGDTVDQKSAISDNGTTFDRGEFGTGP